MTSPADARSAPAAPRAPPHLIAPAAASASHCHGAQTTKPERLPKKDTRATTASVGAATSSGAIVGAGQQLLELSLDLARLGPEAAVLLEVRRLPGDVRKLVEPVDGLRRLAHLLSGEANHATDGRPRRRPWRGRRSDDHQLQAVIGPALERLRRTFTNRASYHHFWREHPAFRDPDI
jgi:hypothetical protein